MEWTIREARLADCAAITRLNREELGYDFPEERTREKLRACLTNPVHKIFVAESGGEVVGYLHLEDYDVLYFPHMKNVLGIAVSGACRRQGVAGPCWLPGRPGPRRTGLWRCGWSLARGGKAHMPFTKAWATPGTSCSAISKSCCKGCPSA